MAFRKRPALSKRIILNIRPQTKWIWYNENSKIKKIAAIGVRVSKWIAYHGFSLNINNDLKKYNAIIPCGVKDKGITNLKNIKDQNYKEIGNKLIENFISNLEN